jgi:hypothetical protein
MDMLSNIRLCERGAYKCPCIDLKQVGRGNEKPQIEEQTKRKKTMIHKTLHRNSQSRQQTVRVNSVALGEYIFCYFHTTKQRHYLDYIVQTIIIVDLCLMT